MKSKTLTNSSIVVGVLGVIAWAIGGLSQWTGLEILFPFWHWWVDAGIAVLVAIWLKLGAIYHWHLEQPK